MPELPEVEVIARGLGKELKGRHIKRIDVRYAGSVQGDTQTFCTRLTGARVRVVGRRGKLLLMDLQSAAGEDLYLGFHLKMTGRLITSDHRPEESPHSHIIFDLDDDRFLQFHDVRKFGYAVCLSPDELKDWPFLKTLGPEPLELSQAEFLPLFTGRRGLIKGLLLNQTVIAGIGNIYADESLFRAGIAPFTQAHKVPKAKLKALHGHLQDVLKEAIAANGSSIRDYVDSGGNAGAFQNDFRVYGRKGEPCRICESTLQATKVAGRTSTYCTRCQPGKAKART
jgi:formamidopyrimidine-DNA glycosylase